jgi:hypothetical protein
MSLRASPSFDPNPPGWRAEDFTNEAEAEGFLLLSSFARESGSSEDAAIKEIHSTGWELRSFGGELWFRPAIVSRMGPG